VAALAATVVAALALPAMRHRLTGADELASETVSGRLELWRATWAMILDHPWLGVGPSGFADSIPRYLPQAWFAEQPPGSVIDSPHCLPLQVLAAGGVPLAVLAAVFLALAARAGWRAVRSGGAQPFHLGCAAALVGYLAGLIASFPTAATAVPAALMLGALIAIPDRTKANTVASAGGNRSRAVRAAGLVLGGVALATAAAVLTCALIAEYAVAAGLRAAVDGDPAAVDRHFSTAARLRPWDGDVAVAAAQAGNAVAVSYASGERGAEGGRTASDAAALACRWADKAINRLPESVEAARNEALCRVMAGEWDQAAAALRRARDLSPRDLQLVLWQGMVEANTGETAQAIQLFDQAAANPWLEPTATGNAELLRSNRGP
jgi:hypothetical protein